MNAVFEEFYSESDYPNQQAVLDEELKGSTVEERLKHNGKEHRKLKEKREKVKIDAIIERGQIYHYNQWVATMVHNHTERGLKSQAFSNSDYVVHDVKGTNQEREMD